MLETRRINNLFAYLKNSTENEIIVRTTKIEGAWDDIQFDACSAGFSVSIFQNPEYIARHEFAECYRLTRKAN